MMCCLRYILHISVQELSSLSAVITDAYQTYSTCKRAMLSRFQFTHTSIQSLVSLLNLFLFMKFTVTCLSLVVL